MSIKEFNHQIQQQANDDLVVACSRPSEEHWQAMRSTQSDDGLAMLAWEAWA